MNAVEGHTFDKSKQTCECGWKPNPRKAEHRETQWRNHLDEVKLEPTDEVEMVHVDLFEQEASIIVQALEQFQRYAKFPNEVKAIVTKIREAI